MKVIIAGGRDFTNKELLFEVCDKVFKNKEDITIVSGKEPNGADYLGELYAKSKGWQVDEFPADWIKYKKAAGPIRNKQMARHAQALIAFWDGKSTGTGGMIELAKDQNLSIRVFDYSGKRVL